MQTKLSLGMISLMFAGLICFFYAENIFFFPSHIHAWTQSDRFALALKFLDNDFNLFKPQTYNLASQDGITGVDLPLGEWLVALLMQVFQSREPFIFRSAQLAYALVGYAFLFRLGLAQGHKQLKASSLVLFAFSAPILTYYQNGFIPSVSSFSTALIAYYYYFQFKKNDNLKFFKLGVFLMGLACLIRSPFNLFLFAMFLQELGGWLKKGRIIWPQFRSFVFVYSLILGYNLYKNYLNQTYGSQFLTSLLPANSLLELGQLSLLVLKRWAFQLLSPAHYLLWFTSLIALILALKHRKIQDPLNLALAQQTLWISLGACVYYLLMTKQFIDHEYYFIDSFYLPIIFSLSLGLKQLPIEQNWQKLGLVLGLIAGIYASKQIQDLKYAETLWDRGEITRKNFIGAAQFLDELKISRQAKLLILDAYSTNAPLILAGRNGHTVLNTTNDHLVKALNELEFDYIIIQDVFIPSDIVHYYPQILQRLERLGGNGRLSVFKLKTNSHSNQQNLAQILGIPPKPKIFELNFDEEAQIQQAIWANIEENLSKNIYHSPPRGYFLNQNLIFGPSLELALDSLASINKLLFEAYFYQIEPSKNIKIAASLWQGETMVYYWDFPLDLRHIPQQTWASYACLFSLDSAQNKGLKLRVYVWNPEGEGLYLDDLKISLYKN